MKDRALKDRTIAYNFETGISKLNLTSPLKQTTVQAPSVRRNQIGLPSGARMKIAAPTSFSDPHLLRTSGITSRWLILLRPGFNFMWMEN